MRLSRRRVLPTPSSYPTTSPPGRRASRARAAGGLSEADVSAILYPSNRDVVAVHEPRAGDCPRPDGCVIAHPCRICGADRGVPCEHRATRW